MTVRTSCILKASQTPTKPSVWFSWCGARGGWWAGRVSKCSLIHASFHNGAAQHMECQVYFLLLSVPFFFGFFKFLLLSFLFVSQSGSGQGSPLTLPVGNKTEFVSAGVLSYHVSISQVTRRVLWLLWLFLSPRCDNSTNHFGGHLGKGEGPQGPSCTQNFVSFVFVGIFLESVAIGKLSKCFFGTLNGQKPTLGKRGKSLRSIN